MAISGNVRCFNPDFVDKNPNYECVACHKGLCKPLQLVCGHRICWKCLESLRKDQSTEINCPNKNRENCEDSFYDKVFPDRSAEKDMERLTVYCSFKCNGCPKMLLYSDLKKHLGVCLYDYVKCPNDCGESVIRSNVEEHFRLCSKLFHCKFIEIDCPCSFKSKNELQDHELDIPFHVDIVRQFLYKVASDQANLENYFEELERKLSDVEVRLHEVQEGPSNLLREIESVKKLISELKNQSTRLDEYLRNRGISSSASTLHSTSHFSSFTLSDDLRNQLIHQSISLGDHNQKLEKLAFRYQNLETSSHDGILVWKITDYFKRKNNAIMGSEMSVYSPAFFTSRYGYKMCCRAFLNGDGVGKGTHLSLFFVIMRGDYDEILKWPFTQKVTFMLIDQKENKKHVDYTFQPDSKSASFQKPSSVSNVASGSPLFVSHQALESPDGRYLRKDSNDSIFIKVIVDISNLRR